jgi:hypothetical protein
MPANIAAIRSETAALPPPIIILGTRASGTALVGAMIGRNPAAFELPALNLFVSETLQEMGAALLDPVQSHGLLRALAYLYGSEQTIVSIGMARRWVLPRMSWSTVQVFDALRAKVAPRHLVEKSAIYSRNAKYLQRIQKYFPDARYVHVVEHPLTRGAVSVARQDGFAALRAVHNSAETSHADQLRWLHANRLISDAMQGVGTEHLVVLRMDRLLRDPRAEFASLCACLKLPDDEAAVTGMLHPENSPFAGFGPVGANLGDDPRFLRDPTFPPKDIFPEPMPPPERVSLLPEVAWLAARYGYE